MSLSEKLILARKSRGWTVYGAARRTYNVHHYALFKLESGDTTPENVRISTAVDLYLLYWPDLQVRDFLFGQPGLKVNFKRVGPGRRRKETLTHDEKKRQLAFYEDPQGAVRRTDPAQDRPGNAFSQGVGKLRQSD